MRPLVVAVDRAFRELFSAVDTALDTAAAQMGINRTDLRRLEVLDRVGHCQRAHWPTPWGCRPRR